MHKDSKWAKNILALQEIDKRNINEKWDMGKTVNDKVFFPLSNDWRKKETREADCTERIDALLKDLVVCSCTTFSLAEQHIPIYKE